MQFLIHFHSGFRYLVLLALVFSLITAIKGLISKEKFTKNNALLTKFTVLFVHIQLLTGLILYFISGKVLLSDMKTAMSNSLFRFFTVEHLTGMIIAIILITIGNARAKRSTLDAKKFKTIALFFGLGLVLILASIPWSFLSRFNP